MKDFFSPFDLSFSMAFKMAPFCETILGCDSAKTDNFDWSRKTGCAKESLICLFSVAGSGLVEDQERVGWNLENREGLGAAIDTICNVERGDYVHWGVAHYHALAFS